MKRHKWYHLFLLCVLLLTPVCHANEYVEQYNYLKKISDCTEVALPILGFASVLVNTNYAKGRQEKTLKILGGRVNESDVKNLGHSFLAFASSLAHVAFYKQWVYEKRPIQGREEKVFAIPTLVDPSEFRRSPVFYSFPSSHSSKMFFGAATIHKEFGFLAASPFYLLSAVCSGIRLYRDNHFMHDLVAGAMIGAKLAFSNDIANFIPTPTKDGGAVRISFKY